MEDVILKYDKYLVTGGAGFIGSHIAETLVKMGKEVVVVDNLVNGDKDNFSTWWEDSLCTFYQSDICNYDELLRACKGVDVIFHNAASKCTVCHINPDLDLNVNAGGALNVCKAARESGVKKVVHASTGSVYGDSYIINEDLSNFNPKSFYGVSKLAGERYYKAFAEYYSDFRYAILRYFNVYGTRQSDKIGGGVIPIFIRNSKNGKPIVIYGGGEQKRSFTHVDDIVKLNLLASNTEHSDGEDYNCASALSVSINDLAKFVMQYTHNVKIIYDTARRGDIKEFTVDNSKVKEAFNFNFKLDFEYELGELVFSYGNPQARTDS